MYCGYCHCSVGVIIVIVKMINVSFCSRGVAVLPISGKKRTIYFKREDLTSDEYGGNKVTNIKLSTRPSYLICS
jgi:hypothetical protein